MPVIAWLILVALLGATIRYAIRLRRDGLPRMRRRGVRGWTRALVPSATLIVIGGGLLIAAPLGLARHFAPDTGWAVTFAAWICLAWGAARLGVTIAACARPARHIGPTPPQWSATRHADTPPAASERPSAAAKQGELS